MMFSVRVVSNALINHSPVGLDIFWQPALLPGLPHYEGHHVDVDTRGLWKGYVFFIIKGILLYGCKEHV